jgi:hypothetical protein
VESSRAQQYDLRENLNQVRVQDRNEKIPDENKAAEEVAKDSGMAPMQNPKIINEGNSGKEVVDGKSNVLMCKRCGKVGHKSEECFRPLVCPRCKKEGHVARACPEIMPWECIAPFCGLAAPELGFHVIQDDGDEEAARENANLAVITIKEGDVTARQVEGEFKAQAGQNSTWRWYAKRIADKKFQMKFPTASKVEELAFFNGMEMRTVPGVKFKVDKWNPHVGAKAEINTAWFRISGVPIEKRSEKIAALIVSLVGVPFEVDKNNLKRGDYIRVKIGCRDISKVPARVEGLLDRHFYDFTFQREVPVEGASTSWNTWTRNADRNNEDNPSPKKARKGEGSSFQKGKTSNDQGEGELSSQEYGRRHADNNKDKETEAGEIDKENKHAGDGSTSKHDKGKSIEENVLDEEDNKSDSEDSGPYFDDFMSPGGQHFTFGDFQNLEIQNIMKMRLNERTVAINEYGTNMIKYKYDPLAVIEAKFAMTQGKGCGEGNKTDFDAGSLKTTEVITDVETQMVDVPTQPSPGNGTQEPTADWSSQEDNLDHETGGKVIFSGKDAKKHQSPNWESLEEGSDKDLQDITEPETEEVGKEEETAGDTEMIQEERPTRQSQRIKEQGCGGIKIAEKAAMAVKKKNLEGNLSKHQNSFAVLSNNEISDRARNMGVRIENNFPEKCDLLRELERARANLCEKDTKKGNEQDGKDSDDLPLEEMRFIEWKSDSSDEEGYHLVTSRKKKKLKRRLQKQKEKGTKKGITHPIDEVTNCRGEVSRYCSRYNLRKGATINKIQ